MNSKQRRGTSLLLSSSAALGFLVIVQPGCMPDFNSLSSEWRPAAGAAGKGAHGGSSGVSGHSGFGGSSNGGLSTGGTAAESGAGTGGTSNPGGEGGVENAGTGAVNEGGAADIGGTSGTGGTTTGTGGTTTGTGGTTTGTGGTTAMGGEGGVQCDPGLTTCPGAGECETSLSDGTTSGSTVTDCGACGLTCPLTNALSATCSAGNCRPTCSANFADCNATTANDGCEADLTNTSNCGRCGHVCSHDGATSLACTSGLCAPTCAAKYLDCTPDTGTAADSGCETYLDGLTTCGTSCNDGVTCNPDQVCNGGVCGAANGLTVMTIPFTASGQGQRYADKFSGNLEGSKLVLRLYAPGATNGNMNVYFEDTSFRNGPMTQVLFSTLSAGWTDVVVDCGQKTASFDPTLAYQVTLEFYVTGSGPWANPTVVYLDSVRSTNQLINDTFDTSTGNMVTSSLLVVPGSSFGWTAAMP